MKISFDINGKIFEADMSAPADIAIPLVFGGPQPGAFGVPAASAVPVCLVADGAGANCETYTVNTHCNGTHTEGVGHILRVPVPVCDLLAESLVPATLITVESRPAPSCGESYDPPFNPEDSCITRGALERALDGADRDFLAALAIRTLPNGPDKAARNYDQAPPPFFSKEGMEFIAALGVRHLLVDVPSVDRLRDEGKLTNHHTFWGVPYGAHDIAPQQVSRKTITELICVPDSVKDGRYLLNLQIAPFACDAAPSRPRLYKVTEDSRR